MDTVVHDVGTVRIDTWPYRLVRTEEARAWIKELQNEPPWAEGAPSLASEPLETWHLGGLKSRAEVPGTTESGKNTDCRWPGRILPGPKINTVTLTGSNANPTCIFEAIGYIWIVAGRHVFRVDPLDDSVVLSQTFPLGVLGVMGTRWEDDQALVTTDAAIGASSLWRVTLGAFESTAFDPLGFQTFVLDGWEQTADVDAYRLVAGINRLFKVDKQGLLRNVSTGIDPMVEANWADNIQCGAKDVPPTALVAFDRSALVGKPDGLFGVDQDGFGVPLITQMIREDTNCLGMTIREPRVLVPHARGVYSFIPGDVQSVGIERELLNESPVRGRFKDFAVDGKWTYGLLASNVNTHLMVLRQRQPQEPGFGPLVWDTLTYMASQTSATIHPSALATTPRIWFGRGNHLAYIILSDGGGAPDVDGSAWRFETAGPSRTLPRMRFGDWGPKDHPKITIVGENLDVTTYWEIYYSVDGAAFSKLDVDGNNMRIDSDTRVDFFLPSAVGREIQFRLDYTSDDDTQAGAIRFLEPFSKPQPRRVPVVTAQLGLRSGATHETEKDHRSALGQYNALEALAESGAAVNTTGPWGTNVKVWVRDVRLTEVVQRDGAEPELIATVQMQVREEA